MLIAAYIYYNINVIISTFLINNFMSDILNQNSSFEIPLSSVYTENQTSQDSISSIFISNSGENTTNNELTGNNTLNSEITIENIKSLLKYKWRVDGIKTSMLPLTGTIISADIVILKEGETDDTKRISFCVNFESTNVENFIALDKISEDNVLNWALLKIGPEKAIAKEKDFKQLYDSDLDASNLNNFITPSWVSISFPPLQKENIPSVDDINSIAPPEPITEPILPPEPITEPDTNTEPITEPDTNTEPITEPDTNTEPITEPDTNTEPILPPEPITEPDTNTEPILPPEPITEPDTNTEPSL